jgi:endonuclease YncB( thermonuclease family)
MIRRQGNGRGILLGILATGLVLIGAIALWLKLHNHVRPDAVTLVRVSDGDTIVVENRANAQMKIRLVGVDAPELGTAASFRSALFAAELCEKATEIRVEPEPTRSTDKYGRLLGWVWLTMPDGRRTLLNHELIHSGNAEVYEPTSHNVKYYNQLR